MTPDDAEEFTRSLGQIIGGSWRQIALAKRLGVPKALGLTIEQWVNERLGGYVKRSAQERISIVKELTKEGYSNVAIGEVLGVDEGTIRNDRRSEISEQGQTDANVYKLEGNDETPAVAEEASENSENPINAVAALAADETIQRAIQAEKRRQERQQTRDAQHVEDGCTVDDLQTLIARGKKFGVIYADPPWVFKVYSGKGKARSADRHYKQDDKTGESTLSIEDLKALPISDLAAPDCALLLWAVMPELPGALEVMKAWGFTYKTTAFVWVKTTENAGGILLNGAGLHWGMGYWTRANAEVCLLGTRGKPKRKAKDVHQTIVSPVGEHSRKPEQTNARIERLLNGPYLELFARRPMHGWSVWGNDITRGLFHQTIPELTEAAE